MNILEISKSKTFWITNNYNIKYLTGFTGSTSECIIKDGVVYLVTDGRYKTQVKEELFSGIEVIFTNSSRNYFETVCENIDSSKVLVLESTHINADTYVNIIRLFKEVELEKNIIENYRIVKNEIEIQYIKKACEITDQTFSYIVKNIKPGMSELEVKGLIITKMIELGAEKESFEPIVASGKNGAKPHARASRKMIESGDMITLDFGCYYKGYVSDMTRSFFLDYNSNDKLAQVHSIIIEAMDAQIKNLKPGVLCCDIDKIGRDIISEHGFGEYFLHGTGHGIGLDIHEEPYVNATSKTILKENMIITIEPGIYIENLGGVRIENDCLITSNGCEVLNNSKRNCTHGEL